MRQPNAATRILAHIETHGTQSRKMLEDAFGMDESSIMRSLRSLLKQQPKPIHRERWEVRWENSRKYVVPFYALGDAPCVPSPLSSDPLKRQHKRVRDVPAVDAADTRADALAGAMAGWHHNPSAPPWNAHPTQIAYNPDRDLEYPHTIGTPNRGEAALSLG